MRPRGLGGSREGTARVYWYLPCRSKRPTLPSWPQVQPLAASPGKAPLALWGSYRGKGSLETFMRAGSGIGLPVSHQATGDAFSSDSAAWGSWGWWASCWPAVVVVGAGLWWGNTAAPQGHGAGPERAGHQHHPSPVHLLESPAMLLKMLIPGPPRPTKPYSPGPGPKRLNLNQVLQGEDPPAQRENCDLDPPSPRAHLLSPSLWGLLSVTLWGGLALLCAASSQLPH